MNPEIVPYLGHLAYTLIFFSFIVRKMLWLRGLAIIAGVASISYNYHISSSPLWVPIQWNMLFIATNLLQIVFLLKGKMNVKFNGPLDKVYQSRFQHFTPMEFKTLIDIAYTRSSPVNTVLIENNVGLDSVFLLLEGVCSVQLNGKELAVLREGDFMGEMSFLTDSKTRADVCAKSRITYLIWDKEKLHSSLAKNANLLHRFEGAIGRQLIDAIVRANQKNEAETPPPFKEAC
jgi:hypothetical protein